MGKKRGTTKPKGQVSVTTTPTQGTPTTKTVDLADCATVGGALKALGISSDRKDITLNGQPVTDFASALKANDQLGVAERPQGS